MVPHHLTTPISLQHLTNFSDIFKETKKSESLRLHDRWSILTFSESVVFGVIPKTKQRNSTRRCRGQRNLSCQTEIRQNLLTNKFPSGSYLLAGGRHPYRTFLENPNEFRDWAISAHSKSRRQ